jgi:hypothetical protein
MEIAVGECLRMKEPDFYCHRIFKLMPRWDKSINILRDYIEK